MEEMDGNNIVSEVSLLKADLQLPFFQKLKQFISGHFRARNEDLQVLTKGENGWNLTIVGWREHWKHLPNLYRWICIPDMYGEGNTELAVV